MWPTRNRASSSYSPRPSSRGGCCARCHPTSAPCGWRGPWRSRWWRASSPGADRDGTARPDRAMTTGVAPSSTEVRTDDPRAWRQAIAITLAAALVRLVLAALIPLFPDETYYRDWSRHLAGGYFDHPPLIAVLIRAGTTFLGASRLGVRFFPIVAGAVASLAAVGIARRIGGDRPARIA